MVFKCGQQSALSRFTNDNKFIKVKEVEAFGIKALNKEQKFAINLLLDDSVKIVTLIGKAGTGKTLMAIAAGLEKTLEQNKYRKLLVIRPTVTTDDGIGFLPGSKEEKLRPFMAPVYDNLDFLFDGAEGKNDTINMLFEKGIIEVEALSYVRGRSLSRSFIVVDEAQNMTPIMIKTMITRVGKGTKIIFTGDPEQIDTPYLDRESNGLSYLVEEIKDEKISGHITLVKGERSEVAEIGAKLT